MMMTAVRMAHDRSNTFTAGELGFRMEVDIGIAATSPTAGTHCSMYVNLGGNPEVQQLKHALLLDG